MCRSTPCTDCAGGHFSNPGALSTCLCHVASNAAGGVFDIWGPIYYQEVLGLGPVLAGRHIAFANSLGLA